MKNCPFKNCNSFGHINGKYSRHLTTSACPNYYNTTHSEWSDMVYREEGKRRNNDKNCSSSHISLREPKLLGITSFNSLYQFRRAQQCVISDPVGVTICL